MPVHAANMHNNIRNHNGLSIGQKTPYFYFMGYKIFELGNAPSINYKNISSPCNKHHTTAVSYQQGIYNCPSTTTLSSNAAGSNVFQMKSLNWAGYVSDINSSSASSVQGSWIVQTAGVTSSPTYSAQWAGIGGFADSTLIQAGTESDYYGGASHYTGWYELLPAAETPIGNFIISPGDKMYVNITSIPNQTNEWDIILIDKTTGVGFSITVVYNSSRLSSEWVEERPEMCSILSCTLTSLANYNTSYYGSDYTPSPVTNYANMGSGLLPISQLPGLVSVTMVNQSSSGTLTTLATPSALTSDGTSFSVSDIILPTPPQLPIYSLNISASPFAGGNVSPSGITYFTAGTNVVISAVSNNGYTFIGWFCSGVGCYSGTNSSATIAMNNNVTEIANFISTAQQQYTLNVENNGCAAVNGSGIYNAGSYAAFSVAVPSGDTFSGWSGSGNGSYTGTAITQSVVMNNNITEVATCKPIVSYLLTVNSNNNRRGEVYPSGVTSYLAGTDVTISAIPSKGYTFVEWICAGVGCYSGVNESATITINTNISETAEFRKITGSGHK